MSVFFNFGMQRELLAAYDQTTSLTKTALATLTPLIDESHELLGTPGASQAVGVLDSVANGLAADHLDLARRYDFIQLADARTALLLSTRAGRPLQSMLAADALSFGWTYDEALLRRELDQLLATRGPLTRAEHARIRQLERELAVLDAPFTTAQIRGDLDANFGDPRIGVPLRLGTGTAVERGRELLIRALNDTVDPDQILADEFEAFFHENGNLTLVLPGVVDLSNPHLGNDPETNTLRDVDQQAFGSVFSTAVEDNGYAKRIVEWAEAMVSAGIIPPGTPTAIIGHSFGGDTALDLSSDSYFNGQLLNVTHALSAGYNSFPQLEHLPAHSRAVAIKNIYDAVVIAERGINAYSRRPIDRIAYEAIERGVNTVTDAINHVRETFPEFEIEGDRVVNVAPNGLFAEFEGGFDLSNVGHHPDDYIEYLQRVDDPQMIEFFAALNAAGYTTNAVALSIDISDR